MSDLDANEPVITRMAREVTKREDEERADRLLLALSREGFSLPYMAKSRDFFPLNGPYEDPAEQAAALAALKAADDEAWQENRAALLRAIASAIPRE